MRQNKDKTHSTCNKICETTQDIQNEHVDTQCIPAEASTIGRVAEMATHANNKRYSFVCMIHPKASGIVIKSNQISVLF